MSDGSVLHETTLRAVPDLVQRKVVASDNTQTFFPTCFVTDCDQPITIQLRHFGCASPHCGAHLQHPLHPVGSDYYCDEHGEQRIIEWRALCLVEDERSKP